MIYSDKLLFQKDFYWLSEESLLEQLKNKEPSRYQKEQFAQKLEKEGSITDSFVVDFYIGPNVVVNVLLIFQLSKSTYIPSITEEIISSYKNY